MTAEYARRIREAIAECNAYIAKEGARSADLRPPEVAKLLAFYIRHRADLIRRLNDAAS